MSSFTQHPTQQQLQWNRNLISKNAYSGISQYRQGIGFIAQRVDCTLEQLSKTLLPRIGFSLVLVMQKLQLLSFQLFCFKMGDFSSQTVDLSLQQRIISCEAINLSLQR
jgi:hypothetical protein